MRLKANLSASFLLLAGCGTTSQSSQQLARIAKDWCLSVRASQIIPVYPLTEDLEPGDVFLVQTPIEDQISAYEAQGFLPLENLLVRLHPRSYFDFYSPNGYGITSASTVPPRLWQFPTAGSSDFSKAPLAAFPTYGFSINRSEGLNIALPVQGVPIGLNLLDSASAHGVVTITNSYTYGADIAALEVLAKQWATDNSAIVSQFASITPKGNTNSNFFLRVVNRVYLTSQVNVSLFSDEATGGAVSVGIRRPVDLLDIARSGNQAAQNFDLINQLLSRTLSSGPTTLPAASASPAATATQAPIVGGTLKVAMASNRSVSMVETFARPLVIGYIAFDLPILADGTLGAPLATQAQLRGRQVLKGKAVAYGADASSLKIRRWLQTKSNREALITWLANHQPPYQSGDIPAILNGAEFRASRLDIIRYFAIPDPE